MWSKSNTTVVIYVTLISFLVGLYATGLLNPILGLFQIERDQDLLTVALIIFLGVLSCLAQAAFTPIIITGSLASFVALTCHQDPLTRYMSLSALLFSIGIYGMTVSRNAIRMLISIELMLNAVNINMVAFARYVDPGQIRGQIFAVFILTVAAAEAAVGLAIVLAIYRNTQTVDMEKFNLLKW